VAHFRREKGHLRLLQALAEMPSEPPWRVDGAGTGPLIGRITAEIAKRAVDGRVAVTGPIADPCAFWATRDVAVLLSDHEGSPNALIEAAMSGRPMVGTDSGGTADVITDSAGFLCR
jgi:glycosyltransferase involved in cell wall biosynthesis